MIIKDEQLFGKYLIKINFDQHEVLNGEESKLKAKSFNEAANYIFQKRVTEIDKIVSIEEYFEFMNSYYGKLNSFYDKMKGFVK